jgi:alpha-tubulin suppressor-like RCC1 family protein
MRPVLPFLRLTWRPVAAQGLVPFLLVAAAGCGSADAPTGPSAATPSLATTSLPAFVQVAVSDEHSCAVTGAGLIYCWGSNVFGELGDGTKVNRSLPVRVHGGTLRFRRVTAGFTNTCAETTEGKAYCWGGNLLGTLGIGPPDNLDHLTPVAVHGGLTFRSVQSGPLHVCGVTSGEQVYCWGLNDHGEVGRPAGGAYGSPVLVPGGLHFRSVSAGGGHTCGIATTSVAYCWGEGTRGQLGDSTTKSRNVPAPVYGSRKFKQISAGGSHTCALTTTDRAFCWGDNSGAQLGLASFVVRRLVPSAVRGDHLFQGLSAGGVQNCATDLQSHAFCWGTNAFGQLGDGTTETRAIPVAVKGGLTFDRLNTGLHSCGLVGSKVYCWGENEAGQVGDGTTIDRFVPVPVGGS